MLLAPLSIVVSSVNGGKHSHFILCGVLGPSRSGKLAMSSGRRCAEIAFPSLTKPRRQVRDAIAESSEAAYNSLPMGEALKLLSIKTPAELADYAAMREREWDVDVAAQVVRFREEKKVDLDVPSKRLIVETLSYAKELERIV